MRIVVYSFRYVRWNYVFLILCGLYVCIHEEVNECVLFASTLIMHLPIHDNPNNIVQGIIHYEDWGRGFSWRIIYFLIIETKRSSVEVQIFRIRGVFRHPSWRSFQLLRYDLHSWRQEKWLSRLYRFTINLKKHVSKVFSPGRDIFVQNRCKKKQDKKMKTLDLNSY